MSYPHTFITLTPEERKRIKDENQRLMHLMSMSCQRQIRLRLENKRKPLQTLYLSDQKKTFQNIADYLDVSYTTVRGWIYRYRKDGVGDFISLSDK